MNILGSRLIGPSGLAILICFFLPWVTISCSNMEMLNEVSAFEIANGINIAGQQSDSQPILYLIPIAALALLFTGVKLWQSPNRLISSLAFTSSAIVLVISFLFRYRLNEEIAKAASGGVVFKLDWEIGYWGTFIAAMIGTLGAILSFAGTKKDVSGKDVSGTLAYGVIVLGFITAFIHLYLSFQFPDGPDLAFLLNGIGYLVLIGAIYAPIPLLARYRSLFCWLLIAYTALTILLWFFFGANAWYAYLDKTVEIALILFAWLETRRFSE